MNLFHRKTDEERQRVQEASRMKAVTDILLTYSQAEEQSLIALNLLKHRVLVSQTYAAQFTHSREQLLRFLVGVGMYAYFRGNSSSMSDAIAKAELERIWQAQKDKGADLTSEEASICRMQAREGINIKDYTPVTDYDILVVSADGDPKVLAHWSDMSVDIVSVMEEEE